MSFQIAPGQKYLPGTPSLARSQQRPDRYLPVYLPRRCKKIRCHPLTVSALSSFFMLLSVRCWLSFSIDCRQQGKESRLPIASIGRLEKLFLESDGRATL